MTAGQLRIALLDVRIEGLHGALSPDGRRLAFQRWIAPGVTRLFVSSLDGSHVLALDDADPTVPRWTSDGEIVYCRPAPDLDLFSRHPDKPSPQRLTEYGDAWGSRSDPPARSHSREGIDPSRRLWLWQPGERPRRVGVGWHAAVGQRRIFAVRVIDGVDAVGAYDIEGDTYRTVVQGRLPCPDRSGGLFYCGGTDLISSDVRYLRMENQDEAVVVGTPHRHPEVRRTALGEYLVFENCPTEDSTILVAEVFRNRAGTECSPMRSRCGGSEAMDPTSRGR